MTSCWKCSEPLSRQSYLDLYFCSHCGCIVPIEPGTDHFAAFGFAAPACDKDELRKRHLELSRRLHPDFYMTASDQERSASSINVSAVNDAYRCLADPMARASYWLEMAGNPLGKDNNRVDSALAAELFDLQELIIELKAAAASGSDEKDELAARAEAAHAELEKRFDDEIAAAVCLMNDWPSDPEGSAAALEDLKQSISRASYLRTIIRNLKGALDQTWQRSVA